MGLLVPHHAWPNDWLAKQAAVGRHVWAVVDASADQARTRMLPLDALPGCVNLLDHIGLDAAAWAVAPRVVPLELQRSVVPLRALWAEQPTDDPMLFLIATHWPSDVLLQAMRRRVRVRLDDGQQMLFRWWDPRVWWALHQPGLIENADVQVFMSFVTASAWPGRDGSLQTALSAPLHQDALSGESAWPAGAEAFSGLLTLGHADAVLSICRTEYAAALQLVHPAERHAIACAQIAWAECVGLTSASDHALAVRIAAEVGPDWASRPEWAAVVKQAVSSGQTLVAALAAP